MRRDIAAPTNARARRRGALGMLAGVGLLPFVVGAAPDAGEVTAPNAPQACPAVPAGEPFITGLASGQAMTSGEVVTLRFSNNAFECGQALTTITSEGCRNDWSFSLTLPAHAVQPGSYNLAELSAQFGDLFGIAGPPRGGCNTTCTMSAKGDGAVVLTDPAATLQIFSADDKCLTGKISGLEDPLFSDAPDFNGAFFAVRCSP